MKAIDYSKAKKAAYAGMLVLLTVIAASPFLVVSAQSIKGEPTPPATSISSQSPSPSQAAVEPRDVVEPNADKYKLIFARQYEGRKSYDSDEEEDREAFVQETRSKFEHFVVQLNTAGSQGYKFVSAYFRGGAVGMVKFDGVQYEYDWVMSDQAYVALSGKDAKYEGLTKRGFRFVQHFEITIDCSGGAGTLPTFPTSPNIPRCQTKDVLLLEKQKGVDKPTPYALLMEYHDKKLVNDLKQKLAAGFFPTYLFNDNQILVELTESKDGRVRDKQDVQMVIGSNVWGGGDPSKSKINELAKHGYRLALINDRIAIMDKDGETATPVTYVWLHTITRKNWKLLPRKRKDFEEKLASLQASGAIYKVVYENSRGDTHLIFEQRAPDDGKRYEYKVLSFEFQSYFDAAAHKWNIELEPASKEAVKQMNSLVRRGFVVRDLFLSDKVSVLLERSR